MTKLPAPIVGTETSPKKPTGNGPRDSREKPPEAHTSFGREQGGVGTARTGNSRETRIDPSRQDHMDRTDPPGSSKEAALADRQRSPSAEAKNRTVLRPKRLSSRFRFVCIKVHTVSSTRTPTSPPLSLSTGKEPKSRAGAGEWTKSISVRESFLRDYPSVEIPSSPKTPHPTVSLLPCSPLLLVYHLDLRLARDFEHDAVTWSAPDISLGTWTFAARERSQPIFSGNWRGLPPPSLASRPRPLPENSRRARRNATRPPQRTTTHVTLEIRQHRLLRDHRI